MLAPFATRRNSLPPASHSIMQRLVFEPEELRHPFKDNFHNYSPCHRHITTTSTLASILQRLKRRRKSPSSILHPDRTFRGQMLLQAIEFRRLIKRALQCESCEIENDKPHTKSGGTLGLVRSGVRSESNFQSATSELSQAPADCLSRSIHFQNRMCSKNAYTDNQGHSCSFERGVTPTP